MRYLSGYSPGMKDVLMWTADFVKDRPVYPILRRSLNIVFVASIASWWYYSCYGDVLIKPLYTLGDWYDYLLKGKYFIPAAMFTIVFVLSWLVSFGIYKGFGLWLGIKLKRQIIRYQATYEDTNEGLGMLSKVGSYFTTHEFNQDEQAQFYTELKTHISAEDLREIQKEINKAEGEMCDNFIMVFRMLCACIVYYIVLPEFSGWLMGVLLVVLVIVLANFFVAGLFFDILPVLASKLDDTAQAYFSRRVQEPEVLSSTPLGIPNE